MMGYAANGFCFGDAAAAAAYACGKEYPLSAWSVDSAGHPVSIVIECTGTVDNVLTLQRDVNGLVDGTSSLALTSPPCDPMEWHTFYPFSWSAQEGAVLGAAIIFVWSVGWGFRAMIAALHGGSSVSGDAED